MNATEEQRLRTLLGSLTPQAPASVTDASPVVRRARQRRRRTGAALGAAALVAAAVVVPVWLNRPDGDGGAVAGAEQEPDPFSALPCQDLPAAVSEGFDAASVTAARLCVAADDLGFTYAGPPADALVTGLERWAAELGSLPAADPGRCAAVDVMPTPVRLLVEQGDGTRLLVDPNLCGNVTLGSTTVDGGDVGNAFLQALADQRAAMPKPDLPGIAALECSATPTMAVPTESLGDPVDLIVCWDTEAIGSRQGTAAELRAALGSAERDREAGVCFEGPVGQAVSLDTYGDVLRWYTCDQRTWVTEGRVPQQTWTVTLPTQ